MIRFVLRLVGLLCLAGSFFFLVYDGAKSIVDSRWYLTQVRDVWGWLPDNSFGQLGPTVERMAPWLVDPVLNRVVGAPTSLVLLIIGAILLVVGRKRRPLIGYGRD